MSLNRTSYPLLKRSPFRCIYLCIKISNMAYNDRYTTLYFFFGDPLRFVGLTIWEFNLSLHSKKKVKSLSAAIQLKLAYKLTTISMWNYFLNEMAKRPVSICQNSNGYPSKSIAQNLKIKELQNSTHTSIHTCFSNINLTSSWSETPR